MSENELIAPCRLVDYSDGTMGLLLLIDFDDRHETLDALFEDCHREHNGYGWNQVIQTLIPADVLSTLHFDPEADMVCIRGSNRSVLVQIAQDIRQLLDDEAALREALLASELD